MKTKVNTDNRLKWIDLSKGIGILLVVLGHMLRGFTSSGMYIDKIEILKYIDFTIYSFHMPLFFIVSGQLYNNRFNIKNNKEYLLFLLRKLKLLMIPYLVFTWIQICIKIVMSGSVNSEVSYRNLITIFIKPIEQFWFLYALMIIFIVMTFIDFKIKGEKIKVIIVIMLSILIRIIPFNLGIIGVAISNIIYFYMGRYIINILYMTRKNIRYIALLVAYIVFNIVVYKYNISNTILIVLLAFIGSAVVILTCDSYISKYTNISKIIEVLGKYSMAIYLLHVIFMSGVRIILKKLYIDNFIVQSILGLIAGIIIPIIIAKIYAKYLLMSHKTA